MKKALNLILLLAAVVISSNIKAQESFDYDKIAPHPRLLMPAGGEDKIRELIAGDEIMARVHTDIMAACEKMLSSKPVKRRDNPTKENNILGSSRTAEERIFNLSYAYRMTGDTRYADRAVEEMLAVSAFIDWNPLHFLDVGEMAMALAFGYDWLFDYLTPETRETVREAILIKAFKTAEETNARFYNDINNWNSVCNASFVYAALAIFDEAPEESKFVIEKALKTNPLATESFGPDGGYPEGYNYWGYGATFQMLLSAGLDSALGHDCGIADAPGFLQSARFIQFMTTPRLDNFSFSDSPVVGNSHFALFWFAKKCNDPSLLWLEHKYMVNEICKYAANRLMPALLIFASELDYDWKSVPEPSENFWFNRGDTPVFIYRSGWDRTDDTYLGVKAGCPQNSHAHIDAGSFVFEKHGARWSTDLGTQGYEILNHGVDLWGKGQDSDRWRIFRISNQAHSTITVNEEVPIVTERADITKTFTKKSKKGAVVDLSQLYGFALEKAERTIWLDRKDDLTVVDNIVGGEDEANIRWVMCTCAEAEIISESEIELTIGDNKMMLCVESPADFELAIWSNVPPRDFENSNEGTQRVGFTTSVAAHEAITLKVTLKSVE